MFHATRGDPPSGAIPPGMSVPQRSAGRKGSTVSLSGGSTAYAPWRSEETRWTGSPRYWPATQTAVAGQPSATVAGRQSPYRLPSPTPDRRPSATSASSLGTTPAGPARGRTPQRRAASPVATRADRWPPALGGPHTIAHPAGAPLRGDARNLRPGSTSLQAPRQPHSSAAHPLPGRSTPQRSASPANSARTPARSVQFGPTAVRYDPDRGSWYDGPAPAPRSFSPAVARQILEHPFNSPLRVPYQPLGLPLEALPPAVAPLHYSPMLRSASPIFVNAVAYDPPYQPPTTLGSRYYSPARSTTPTRLLDPRPPLGSPAEPPILVRYESPSWQVPSSFLPTGALRYPVYDAPLSARSLPTLLPTARSASPRPLTPLSPSVGASPFAASTHYSPLRPRVLSDVADRDIYRHAAQRSYSLPQASYPAAPDSPFLFTPSQPSPIVAPRRESPTPSSFAGGPVLEYTIAPPAALPAWGQAASVPVQYAPPLVASQYNYSQMTGSGTRMPAAGAPYPVPLASSAPPYPPPASAFTAAAAAASAGAAGPAPALPPRVGPAAPSAAPAPADPPLWPSSWALPTPSPPERYPVAPAPPPAPAAVPAAHRGPDPRPSLAGTVHTGRPSRETAAASVVTPFTGAATASIASPPVSSPSYTTLNLNADIDFVHPPAKFPGLSPQDILGLPGTPQARALDFDSPATFSSPGPDLLLPAEAQSARLRQQLRDAERRAQELLQALLSASHALQQYPLPAPAPTVAARPAPPAIASGPSLRGPELSPDTSAADDMQFGVDEGALAALAEERRAQRQGQREQQQEAEEAAALQRLQREERRRQWAVAKGDGVGAGAGAAAPAAPNRPPLQAAGAQLILPSLPLRDQAASPTEPPAGPPPGPPERLQPHQLPMVDESLLQWSEMVSQDSGLPAATSAELWHVQDTVSSTPGAPRDASHTTDSLAIEAEGAPGDDAASIASTVSIRTQYDDTVPPGPPAPEERPYIPRPRLGLEVEVVAPDRPGAEPLVLVHSVLPDSPAHRAGVQAGDLLVHWDGRRITSPTALCDTVAAAADGASVVLDLLRAGQRLQRQAVVGGR